MGSLHNNQEISDQPKSLPEAQLNSAEKFLSLPSNVQPSVEKIADHIRKLNQRTPFLEKFIKKEGFAIWDKAFVKPWQSNRGNNSAQADEVLIPLVFKDSSKVHAALACKVIGDSVYINLLDGRLYRKYNTIGGRNGLGSKELSLALMMLDKRVFGHKKFQITDSAAFGNRNVKLVRLLDKADNTANRMVLYTVQICWEEEVQNGYNTGCPPGDPCPQTYTETKCQTYSGWYDDGVYDDAGGGGSTGGSTGGGSGSGGGWTDPTDPCANAPRAARLAPSDDPCSGGGSTGWEPVEEPYELTFDDLRIWNKIKQEDAAGDAMRGRDCMGTNRSGNIQWAGTIEHWLIMIDYLSQHPMTGEVEFQIPNAGPNGARGYADIVNRNTGEMYEIKPNSSTAITAGGQELNNYVAKATIYCNTSASQPWRTGFNYNNRVIFNPKTGGSMVVKLDPASPGVLVYFNNPIPYVPVPVSVPSSVLDRLKHLINKLKNAYPDYETPIAQFFGDPANADIIAYIKGAAIGAGVAIIVGTLIEDVVTAGTGIGDDAICFQLAWKIIRFGLNK